VISVGLIVIGALAAERTDSCDVPPLLPAYSHNDYLAPRPLAEALGAGYRGVEVDLYRDGNRLLVGHDRRTLRPKRTLEELYLRPLEMRLSRCDFVLAPNTTFFLNLELKERDPEALRLLVNHLESYSTTLFGRGQVRAVLVGWWPTLQVVGQPWPAYLGVQLPFEGKPEETIARAGPPISLLSVDYSKSLRWNGRGSVPRRAQNALAEAVRLGRAIGVPVRVHQARVNPRVFTWLLETGVDLIGVKELGPGTELLAPHGESPNTSKPDPVKRTQ